MKEWLLIFLAFANLGTAAYLILRVNKLISEKLLKVHEVFKYKTQFNENGVIIKRTKEHKFVSDGMPEYNDTEELKEKYE